MKKALTVVAALALLVTSMAAIRNTLLADVVLTPEESPYNIGPVNVQNNVTRITAEFSRRDWPGDESTPAVAIDVEVSFNNGQTWQPLVGDVFPGGIVRNALGVIRTNSTIRIDLPPGNGRRLRATVNAFTNILTDITIITE
jgi:hypothetical protein